MDGDSEVTGAVVVTSGDLDLDDVDIDGHVYVDSGDLNSCSGVTIGPNDEGCGTYSFRDPDDC